MGHTSAKDIYHQLGKKIDGLITRAPWNQTLFEILKELYTLQEAEVLVRMSYSLSTFEQVAIATKFDRTELQRILDGLCEKGLVFDILLNDKYYYIQSPMVVGIFEMTMMRTKGELRYEEWAKLFHRYLNDSDDFYAANFKYGEKVSPMRVVPHEETIDDSSYVEILDYEKAKTIIENTSKFSIGLCSCRHEKLHVGEKTCNVPLETCSSFGPGADLMIRHGFAREVSKSEMLENVARSKELGLVLTADNVQKEVGFMCHCCGCCCNLLLGVSKHGYPNSVVTSTFIAEVNDDNCSGCVKCSKACPIDAISMIAAGEPNAGKRKLAKVDKNICLGCGVCALSCNKKAIKLTKRTQRVLHPENTFQRVILASLEKGTLQNQLFGEPQKISHKFLRGFVGGFLRIPLVKQSLMNDQLRSRFLATMESAARKKGLSGV
jgi:ferredoxin